MASSTRTNGRTRLQHVQREADTGLGFVRTEAVAAAAAAITVGPIEAADEAALFSQGRPRGLGVGVMDVIQVRDDDDDDARVGSRDGTRPDIIGIGMFWMP